MVFINPWASYHPDDIPNLTPRDDEEMVDESYDTIVRPYSEYNEKYRLLLISKDFNAIPCWSLAALLDILPDEITDNDDVYRNMFFHLKGKYVIQYPRLSTLWPSLLSVEADNPVDACVAMIVKLYEQKLI